MRSAVSVILSSPVQDPNMSHPDYDQTAMHHASLLILVKHLGEELSTKSFNKYFERISRINSVKITDSNGITREILARYIKEYPVGNNEWGEFQTHRRLLGLISLSKVAKNEDVDEMCRMHESTKVRYCQTLYDSRSIMVTESEDLSIPNEFKSRSLLYPVTENGDDSPTTPTDSLQNDISEFISSLFWVLESKRQERSREKLERVSLVVAPFERKDFVGLDMESRSNKRRSIGRMAKHLGDLCLQAGLRSDALTHYHAAVDTLRAVNDWLWLGSACEGLAVASVCVRFPKMYKSSAIHRNSSLQEGNMKNRPSITAGTKNLEVLEPSSLPNLTASNALNAEDICKSYREAIVHYSKYQHAGVIETEACFKAARVALELNLVLQAASFLQNIIFINLTLPEDEKIERLMTLSDLYGRLGLERKASFYRRLAATRYVSARNPHTDWERFYSLMLQALPGHKLTLDPADYSPYGGVGWGGLQKQVLLDVAGAARRAGLVALATRHMTLLLQVMWRELSPSERSDCALQLQSVASQCEGSPVSLILESGLVIPPANLLHIPTAQNFVVQKLKPHLQPTKLEKMKEDYGPFVFTPLKFGSLERKNVKDSKLNYLWVAEEPCEVKLELANPLPFELEVHNMRLLTSGVVFESLPVTVTLPPTVSNYPVTLLGTPREVGELQITGYSTHTLGVKSNCRLKSLAKIPQAQYVIEVVPALPILNVNLIVPDFCNKTPEDAQGSFAVLSLFAGETVECTLSVENASPYPIEVVELSCSDSNIISYDCEVITNALPLAPKAKLDLPVSVFAAASFINTFPPDEVPASVRSGSVLSGVGSFPSMSSFKPVAVDHLSSTTASVRSGPSSLNSMGSQINKFNIENSIKGVECRVKVKYSGSPGLNEGYCRVCVANLKIEIHNSIIITNWDVLPAETSNQFYLVVDFANMTQQELELLYTVNKTILIEENESCRVPIPLDRCPLDKIAKYYEMAEGSIEEIVEVNAACSEHIASLVEVSWVTGERKGKASLHGITLSSNVTLDIVRMSPVDWDVSIDGVAWSGSTCSVIIGMPVQVSVTTTNRLSSPLREVAISCHLYQDYQNGTCNFMMDTRLAVAGPSALLLPVMEEHASATYQVCIVFFCCGQYKMNVQCTSQKRHIWRLLPAIEVEVKPPDS